MKKGCIVAVAVLGVFVLLCVGGGLFLSMKMGNAMMMAHVEAGIAEYQEALPDATIETTNEAWAEALTAGDVKLRAQFIIDQLVASGEGELVDQWGSAIRLSEREDGFIVATSPGKDQAFDTEDDETGERARAFVGLK